ncbi:glycosyltransferase family 9 protein [Mucilaginibacter sp. RS28]|uniref:Glycosyltransferase family 9 protein n=1 Tax=Mucilaginibacter straminoryzae TaxID=2932774 RepID=A0A9X1X637_9SPHI|nr:glycosyltransferase family 9 protein [Mucilaginibacter straminoryzae]MCJ8210328.1 glycosyltransferase family 9 protein [Mucilaginibacter straminoryzae]
MSPKKIAVVRANALGDFIFVLPALQALRDTYPDAEIVYLGKAWHQTFLENRPSPISRVAVVPPYGGVGEAENFENDENILKPFFTEMQAEQFDIAIQMHGGGFYSNPFTKRLGAKVSVGLKTPNAIQLDINVPYIIATSEILRYIEVVRYLGASTADPEPSVKVINKDLQEAKNAFRHNAGERYAVIHPGASDMRRRWPAENFAAIANYLVDQGYHVYITGSEYERADIERLFTHITYPDQIHNLCADLSLNGMTGLLAMADVLVSNDTGPLHLARALKKPTIGIYWTINAVTGMALTTSRNRSLIAWDPYCPLCGTDCVQPNYPKDNCKHEASFTAKVSIDEVKNALQDLLLTEAVDTAA